MDDEPRGREDIPVDRLCSSVEEASARIGLGDAPRERLRRAVETAAARALEACGRGDCAACDRIWSGPGLPCRRRMARHLAKRLAMALLPMMRRGWPLEAAREVLGEAAARALAPSPAGRG